MSKDKDQIRKALEDLEKTSVEINSRKAREEARIKKLSRPLPVITRDASVKSRARDSQADGKWKTQVAIVNGVLALMGLVVIIIYVSRGNQVDMVFYSIVAVIYYGWYKLYMNSL